MKDRLKKVWEWTEEHSFEVMYGGCIVAMIGLSVAAVRSVRKAEDARYEMAMNALESGKAFLPNPDGSMWIIELAEV